MRHVRIKIEHGFKKRSKSLKYRPIRGKLPLVGVPRLFIFSNTPDHVTDLDSRTQHF
jgi:hypothetical protein